MAEEGPIVPSTSAPLAQGLSGSGQVLTDAVLQTQRETIGVTTVIAEELKEIKAVMCNINYDV